MYNVAFGTQMNFNEDKPTLSNTVLHFLTIKVCEDTCRDILEMRRQTTV